MNPKRLTRSFLLIAVAVYLLVAQAAVAGDGGAVYAMTNALGTNQIVVWARADDGTLSLLQTIHTGGGGSGTQIDPTDSLGSQGSVMIDKKHHWLFAVNTESTSSNVQDCNPGSISSFRIAEDGTLALAGRVRSGGLFPDSLTVWGHQLWVLNAGGPANCGTGPNITGFKIKPDGRLTAIAGSARAINPGSSPGSFLNCDPGIGPFAMPIFDCGLNPPAFPRSPGQVGFTPEGDALVVTAKATNSIYVFPVRGDDEHEFDEPEHGGLGKPTIWKAQGPNQPTYFGFSFDSDGHLIVSEPFGATPTIPAVPKSAVSSFAIRENGSLKAISSSVPNGRGTSCWIAVDPRWKRYAYAGNNATSDISSYVIGEHGSLTLLAATAAFGEHPNDLAVAKDEGGSFLYVLNGGNGTVGAFRINRDGSLTTLGAFGGLPADAGAQGLAAY
jgi:6-phosphogluconolactonase